MNIFLLDAVVLDSPDVPALTRFYAAQRLRFYSIMWYIYAGSQLIRSS